MNNIFESLIYEKYFSIKERYKFINKIGQGGYGVVYLAHDNFLNINVAIKEYNHLFSSLNDTKRILKEILIMKYLSDLKKRMQTNNKIWPFLEIYDVFIDPSKENQNFPFFTKIYVSMEFGYNDLRKYLQNQKIIPYDQAEKICLNLLKSVLCLHSLNIIHRDLKPENFLINSSTLEIKIIDFGHSGFFPLTHNFKNNITDLIEKKTSDLILNSFHQNVFYSSQPQSKINTKKKYNNNINSDFSEFIETFNSFADPEQISGSLVNKENFDPNLQDTLNNNQNHDLNITNFMVENKLMISSKILGTRFYRSPELLMLEGHSINSELWSIGSIFLEILLYCPVQSELPQYENSIIDENKKLRLFVNRNPIFRGGSCELFSPSYSKNISRMEKFFDYIVSYEEVLSYYLKNLVNENKNNSFSPHSQQYLNETYHFSNILNKLPKSDDLYLKTKKKINQNGKPISQEKLKTLNKIYKYINKCIICEDDQLLTIIRVLGVKTKDLGYFRKNKFYNFLINFIQKNNLCFENESNKTSYERQTRTMDENEEELIRNYYLKKNIDVNKLSQPEICNDDHQLNAFFQEFTNILGVNIKFLLLINQMLNFDPSKRCNVHDLISKLFNFCINFRGFYYKRYNV